MMSQPVLYSNHAQIVVLLDIPASIQWGQQVPYTVRSVSALDDPYPSTEPKGSKREAALKATALKDRQYHESVQIDISSALAEIQDYLRGQSGTSYWCYRRHALLSEDAPRIFPLETSRSLPVHTTDPPSAPVILSTTEHRDRFPSLDFLIDVAVCNPTRQRTVVLAATGVGAFVIPPRASFILSTLERGSAVFASACRTLLPASKPFHLVLMDPPWSNRSARRSGVYQTSEHQDTDPFTQAVRIVREWLVPGGLVAVWITNKASVRRAVIEAVQPLNLDLTEEWVWIKTTTRGDPVTALDGIWRRPYEILLLFREGQPCEKPKRRIIAAVPDVHSRKPCLKALLEALLPAQYNALELFARSLTAGWWSWGDEVLKFQHESQWSVGSLTKH